MDPISEIIKYISRTKYEDLPKGVVEVVKKAVVDTVGSGIAGSSSPLGKIVAEMVKNYEGKKQSSILFYGDRVPVQEAAWANAIMARSRELDDVHEGNKRRGGGHGGHVSAIIVPLPWQWRKAYPRQLMARSLFYPWP